MSFSFENNMKKPDIIKDTSNLSGLFPDDLDNDSCVDETVQFQKLKRSMFNDETAICDLILNMNVKNTFPNV